VSTSPHDFKLLVAGDGRTATSMDDIVSEKSSLRPVEVPAGGGSHDGDGDAAEQPPQREHTSPAGGPGRPATSTPPPFAA
jgi:hypothetical protein